MLNSLIKSKLPAQQLPASIAFSFKGIKVRQEELGNENVLFLITVTVYESANRKKADTKYDVESIAYRSHLETFGKADKVKITDLLYNDSEKALVELYTEGRLSTFMMIRPKTTITATGNRQLLVNLKYTRNHTDCSL